MPATGAGVHAFLFQQGFRLHTGVAFVAQDERNIQRPAQSLGECTGAGGLLRFVATPAGREALEKLYGVTALVPTVDADYEVIREAVRLTPELAKQLLE